MSEHPVHLPLAQHRRRPRGARASSRPSSAGVRARRASSVPWSTARSSRSSPTGTSKPASRSAVVSEPNVCQISDFDGMAAAALVEIARGRRPAELLAELAQHAQELLAGDEAARHEPGRALRRVPAAEVLDHGLRMDAASPRRPRTPASSASGRAARRSHAAPRGSPRRCSDAAARPGTRRAPPRRSRPRCAAGAGVPCKQRRANARKRKCARAPCPYRPAARLARR